MSIWFASDSVRIYLAQKGAPSVFGREIDISERLSCSEVIAWFDRIIPTAKL